MNVVIRRLCMQTPVLSDVYQTARRTYRTHRALKMAKNYFTDFHEYRKARNLEDGKIVDIRTRDGLLLSIRRNYMDAVVLGEVFLDRCYLQGLSLRDQPVVVDIGGYIGDFALYAAKHLNARKVVVCEPSPRNWALLTKNVANNQCGDRIVMVNKAVTDGKDVMLNVDTHDRGQARVSAYASSNEERKLIPGISLTSLVEDYQLSEIDLLKIDCEGGEYTILLTTPSEIFSRVRNIVFEYHEIDGYEAKLKAVKERLVEEGYAALRARGDLVFASRN